MIMDSRTAIRHASQHSAIFEIREIGKQWGMLLLPANGGPAMPMVFSKEEALLQLRDALSKKIVDQKDACHLVSKILESELIEGEFFRAHAIGILEDFCPDMFDDRPDDYFGLSGVPEFNRR